MPTIINLLFHKRDTDVGGFLKLHVFCRSRKSEVCVEYQHIKQIISIRCEYCDKKIMFYPCGKIFKDGIHKIKTFSRSESNYKPRGIV